MTLERKDVRAKLDHDDHELMKAVAASYDMDDGQWIEWLIKREVRRELHRANVILAAARHAGISGTDGESALGIRGIVP